MGVLESGVIQHEVIQYDLRDPACYCCCKDQLEPEQIELLAAMTAEYSLLDSTMKRKVEQRETQRAYAHARSHSGSEECYKVRRTGHTLCSAGVTRATLPCSLRPLYMQPARIKPHAEGAHKQPRPET
jgi:hypothetical protein